MKKLFMVLVSVLISSVMLIKAQTLPVFSYTHPSLSEIKKLAGSPDEKGHAFYIYLQETVNMKLADTTWRISDAQQLGIDSMFKYISLNPEEIPLKEGTWLNSCYNIQEKKMKASVGHDDKCVCWMFKIGHYSFPIMKEDCANIIRGIGFYAPVYLPIDIAAFDRKLKEITNKFNILSIKVEKNNDELAALKLEMAGMKESQKTEVDHLNHYIWRTEQESQRRDDLLRGGIDMVCVAASGILSGFLWHAAFDKKWVEDDIMREAEGTYTYWQYTLEKQDYTPLPPSDAQSAKSRKNGAQAISTPFNPTHLKPELHFAGSTKYCGDGNDSNNPGCPPPDNNDIYVTINYILNMIINNQVTNNFFEYVTNNIQVLQDFVNNYYTTNNYYEYVTKIEYILNTYNTYVYNTYNNTYITNTYVVATYSLKGELKTGTVKISVLDRGMVKKDNPNKGLCIAGAIISDFVACIFIDRAIHNFQEAHNIKITLKTDLKQMYLSTGNSFNAQLSVVKTFGGRKNHGSSGR